MSAITNCRYWSVSNSRIDKRVRNIDEQIENQNGDCDECDNAEDERLITVEASVDEIIPETWQRKDTLNDDRSGN
jgi:hypothetical protein